MTSVEEYQLLVYKIGMTRYIRNFVVFTNGAMQVNKMVELRFQHNCFMLEIELIFLKMITICNIGLGDQI